MRRFSALLACAAACLFGATAPAALGASSPEPRQLRSPALAVANALPKVRALHAKYPGSEAVVIILANRDWEVLYFRPAKGGAPRKLIGQVVIDRESGRVLEQWTGIQLNWPLARGVPGYVGGHVNALYIWLPLCLLFMLPFFDFRRPFSLLHLDLLVLLSLSISFAFFNHGHIHASVPLVYPPLLYLLARMLALTRRRSVRGEMRPLHLLVPVRWLAVGVVLLIGFRVVLNVTDSNELDVGSASLLGAQRIVNDQPLYGPYPSRMAHPDAYGPVTYEAYVPFQQAFGWNESSEEENLSAPRAAAIVFDLLAVALLFLIGRRVRGPALGIVLAYAWVSYPFTLYALEANSNDALVAVLVLAAVLAATYRSKVAVGARGACAALAGLAKFAPLALAPLLATHGLRELPPARRARALALFLAGFLGAAALVSIPALSHNSLHTVYERTIVYAADRHSPFSLWGLYGGLGGLLLVIEVATVALALALAVVPRRPDVVGLAAACAAVIISTQLVVNYWFYTYIPWFFPLAILALLGSFSATGAPGRATVATPALSSPPPAGA